ncbi:MAG: RNA polymerase sigma factor, partial [Bacteroidota bacterium]
QDLFMKLIEKPHLYNPDRRFSTWLYAIASNMVKNEYRSRTVRRIMTQPGDMSQVSIPVEPEDVQMDRQTFAAHLEHGLDHLSEKHREVIVLRFQDELSIKQISEITTCSEGTVKSRLFYGLRKLASSLAVFDPKK